ncbi:glycosyltransferase family 9 protein [Chitinasiproducens palmae]|uniref:ADP-heptose:LPS heptosyltransferase n=1 Tax=Chitinasiproducens palmae TaxID=1770053 RepID=A0A1H2PQP2_9BURK|nr:glycosyltransferase family 9 protein [Chitinasiproducens palmae]SDV49117.1 ADP-heptose:LPS heptosyltransferase [Chitinasiproducens palmae]
MTTKLPARRIAIFRALVLGDMLCAVPALRALRAAYPDAHITLVGLPWAQAFLDRYPGMIDELMVFPGAIGFPEQPETDAGLPAFWAEARARRFDLAIQLHGSGGIANDIVERMGATHNAGFVQPDERPRQGVFIAWPDTLIESARYDALMRALGVPVDDERLHFPLYDADLDAAEALAASHGIDFDRLVCVHPGAQLPSRRWPSERFAEVADALAADGWQIAITGSAGEAELTGSVLGAMAAPARHVAGQTSLGALGALLSRARLLVSNDTGLSHVAAGVRTPSVVIASGSDTRRWAPLDTTLHQVLADHPPCRPCAHAICPIGHPCARNISSEAVIAAARAKLASLRQASTARAAPSFSNDKSAAERSPFGSLSHAA